MKRKHLIVAVTGLLIALPIAAIAFVKPLRVVAPALIPGVTCPDADICTDDASKLGEARQLYGDGYARAAEAVGNVGVVVAPRGWRSFYLAHELIHFRQAEVLGNVAVATRPRWLIEGMAYSLSGDPRHSLGEPLESWRAQFDAWHASLGARDLWDAARDVR
ncbi:hypothetical protein [Burkholderia ubonensis]|uniref:hypothetical protein n=1 Tax=Burkholderia ubonensis TaxID=101571 RepID=UPI00075A41AA|nr:hypothetical protein [Burkholderia ubonensis]KVP60410.1 hypothetical protein WJ90_29220 [Burkholderia ubonensis]KVR47653.1 hypothetical protein WK16_06300 [Burkholderia ubonensis]OJB18986.1 hypothetical protein BGV48_08790 [Burkholderia ubonensis]